MSKTKQMIELPKIPAGLLLAGVLIGRRRRLVERSDKTKAYCFALTVQTEASVERVEVWRDKPDPEGLPVVGEKVALPVRVRIFQSAVGPQYRLALVEEERGEEV